ncbi:MAG: glycosyltransferase, partial [Thermoanaerobaculia bacterium]|nr:glycosyltransferase [Thermoanaerobaculia bacterium]
PGDVVVGTVAVLRRQKRLDLWLQAARSIAAAARAARCLFGGVGPRADDVRRAAAPLGDRVVLTGLRSDVPELLAAMDVFVSSSQFEGLPLALLEAMAAGLPVVATAVGGVPEVVTEACGRLVAFGAVEPLAVAVTELIAEPAARRALGAAGRRRVEERFSVGRMAAELEACYRHWLCGARRDGEARVG